MARVTVEDCVLKVPNRFDLVMLAAQRSREIASGAQLTVDRDRDKNPVVALREIAEETTDLGNLGESLIQSMQKHVEIDEPEEDAPEFDVPSIPGLEIGASEPGETGASEPEETGASEPEETGASEPEEMVADALAVETEEGEEEPAAELLQEGDETEAPDVDTEAPDVDAVPDDDEGKV